MKYFYTLILFLPVCANAFSQKNNFEIRAGVGYLSDAHFAEAISNGVNDFFINIFSYHDFKITTNGVYCGDVLLSLKNKKIQLGVSYSYEKLSITEYDSYTRNFKRDVTTVMPEFFYNLFVEQKSRLYTGAAMGIKFSNYSGKTDKSTETKFAYHFTWVGFSYGNHVKAFGEFGFGAKGLLRAGVAFSF